MSGKRKNTPVLSTTTSFSSLADMVRSHDETAPLAGANDVEAGPAHYGTVSSDVASYAGPCPPSVFLQFKLFSVQEPTRLTHRD